MNLLWRLQSKFLKFNFRDGRSYSKQLFHKAGSILYKHALKNEVINHIFTLVDGTRFFVQVCR